MNHRGIHQTWMTQGPFSWGWPMLPFLICGQLGSLLLVGCTSVPEPPNNPILHEVRKHPESTGLDIVQVQCPLEDATFQNSLWSEADELVLPVELREQLALHGLRVGVLGTRLPDVLQDRLHLTTPDEQAGKKGQTLDLQNPDELVGVRVQLPAGKRREIQTCQVKEELTVLLPQEDGNLNGETFTKAQGILVLHTETLDKGKVEIEILPQIQHGDVNAKYTSNQEGIWLIQPRRDEESFPELVTRVPLHTGQSLLITCTPDRPSSLGRRLFYQPDMEPRGQKIVLIRLSQEPAVQKEEAAR
ncbi:Hypothetical protein PBC10988_20210 [Planctomycetales bacterium 10988]|nr:Hypothetical protein PBC10988_20210 [Planctomycetales bacterium 10988]